MAHIPTNNRNFGIILTETGKTANTTDTIGVTEPGASRG